MAGALALIGSLGLFRFPDFYTRVHACTLTTVGGVYLAMIALSAQAWLTVYSVKLLLVLVIMMIADPTIAHAIAHSAFSRGDRPAGLVRDESGRDKDAA